MTFEISRMMNKLKVIHIHTDYKFIGSVDVYEGEYFENSIVIIEDDELYKGPYRDKAIFFKKSNINLKKIIELCRSADLVVLHGLDLFKGKIALSLPKHINIAWRFFGYELYKRQEELVLSEKTINARKISYSKKPFNILRKMFRVFQVYFQISKFGKTPSVVINKAINRINYFLALSKEEYNHLESSFELPPFLKLPINRKIEVKEEFILSCLKLKKEENSPIIILGNSKNEFNNHIDIIDLIENVKNKNAFKFILLFNYGPERRYTEQVRQKIKTKPHINTIENFLSNDEFKLLYSKTSALVINSYRQMAVGNVIEGFLNGVKIYLSQKNVMLEWLKNEGFHIFTLEDLAMDLENNNTILSKVEAAYNFKNLIDYMERNSPQNFQKLLKKRIGIS